MNPKNRKIVIIDDLPPEAIAMLQALYSRDPRSVTDHLAIIRQKGPERFMADYYVGYGHKSIGDCGTTTVFIEQVSMLAAKATQEWALYNGQEASTRYLDMSGQEVLNPMGTEEGKRIQDTWMKIYAHTLDTLIPFLKGQFPRSGDQPEPTYEKAIKAKAFDMARGLLPAGATTLLSWHVNLRQAYDHIQQMYHHPLPEVREVTGLIHQSLKEKYPSSFSHKIYPRQEEYIDAWVSELAYNDDPEVTSFSYSSSLDVKGLSRYQHILKSRPEKTELPPIFRRYGNLSFKFPLDFGSFRDLQRHRSGVRLMPLLTMNHGFFPWYLEQYPAELRAEIEAVLAKQEAVVRALNCPDEIKQYYIAMGYTVTCDEVFNLPAAVYVAELRSGQTVHPTLRVVAQQMGKAIAEAVPGIALHCDMNPDTWSIKRGHQDIIKK